MESRQGPADRALSRELLRRLRIAKEKVLWGGELRERLLLQLLDRHYDSLFKRLWVYGREEPHYTNHRVGAFRFGFAADANGPEFFFRGFFSSEILRKSDNLLDIGCGDGFFTKRFFSPRCKAVDAVDIERSAINEATRFNAATNVRYLLLDAVNEPFPRAEYDVVVWDGAIGHFASADTVQMLQKIKRGMAADGIFTGSESLGHEGYDHLQFFESLEDMAALFSRHWKYVQLREETYPITRGAHVRREGYWRCGDDRGRLEAAGWRSFGAQT